MIKWLTFFIIAVNLMGCANFGKQLKSFLRGESASTPTAEKKMNTNYEKKFSENANYFKGPHRQYKRMTRAKLEGDSQLADNSGSLWIMEGQGAYLFSQNIMRMIGDPLAIKIDGEPREQLESKVKIITDLLNTLSAKRKAQARQLAAAQAAKNKKAEATKKPDAKPKTQAGNEDDKEKPEYDSNFPVKTVPTRIVERLVDGNYRIKGSQPFMIGKREYNVIVTGIVRAEDFSEDGISSSKLLDSKFDIVSRKRRETL